MTYHQEKGCPNAVNMVLVEKIHFTNSSHHICYILQNGNHCNVYVFQTATKMKTTSGDAFIT